MYVYIYIYIYIERERERKQEERRGWGGGGRLRPKRIVKKDHPEKGAPERDGAVDQRPQASKMPHHTNTQEALSLYHITCNRIVVDLVPMYIRN